MAEEKKWPTDQDLMAWFLYMKVDETPHPEPPIFHKWLTEFKIASSRHWHKVIWDGFEDFQKEFMPVD